MYVKSGRKMLKLVAALFVCSPLALSPLTSLAQKYVVYAVLFFLVAWLIAHIRHVHLARFARAVLCGMVLLGVLFSIYLTFWEPFAIGATCIWCLTSAVIMPLLFELTMLSAPQAVYSVPGQSAA